MGIARVRLLGEEITLSGDEDPGYLERIAGEVDALLRRISAELSTQNQPTRTALLAAINLQDELAKLKERHARLESGTSTAAAEMVRRIDSTIGT